MTEVKEYQLEKWTLKHPGQLKLRIEADHGEYNICRGTEYSLFCFCMGVRLASKMIVSQLRTLCYGVKYINVRVRCFDL